VEGREIQGEQNSEELKRRKFLVQRSESGSNYNIREMQM